MHGQVNEEIKKQINKKNIIEERGGHRGGGEVVEQEQKGGGVIEMKEKTGQTNTTVRIKKQYNQNGVHPHDSIEKNEKTKTKQTSRVWISQDEEKDVEEKEFGQRGEGESGEKKEKEDGG